MITIYSSGLPQLSTVLCLPIILTIPLSCYQDNTPAPIIANLSTHMETAGVQHEMEVNITDHPDTSRNQDTDNDIITLR